jgi:hypothetical protein
MSKTFANYRATVSFLLLVLAFGLPGCSRGLLPEYGNSKGTSGLKGINGFGALRKSFEANGWKTRDVNRLSERLDSLDAIVWIPTTHKAYESPAIQWVHDWLGDRPRTLVYILPDEGNEVRYWEQSRQLAPPTQRLEYRRRHAQSISNLMNGPYGYGRSPVEEIDRLWFKARMRRQARPRWELLSHSTTLASQPTATTGGPAYGPFNYAADWASEGYELADEDLTMQPLASDSSGSPLAVRIFTPQKTESTKPAPQTKVPDDQVDIFQPDTTADPDADAVAELHEEWEYEDWMDDQEWMNEAQWERMQRRQRGGYGIGESEIIVVAGGSLISNFGIVTDEGRDLVKQLLVESGKRTNQTTPRVGFITSGFAGVPVSDSSGQPQLASGMELLTVWPLSIITIHLALMGVIACLILLPIFGRPRKLKERTNSDFADHINAVGALLHRGNGEQYARQRISEYFRKVRGETSGPWVMPLPHIVTAPPKPVDSADSDTSVDRAIFADDTVPASTEADTAKQVTPKLDTDTLETSLADNHNLPQTPASLNQPIPEPRKDSNES